MTATNFNELWQHQKTAVSDPAHIIDKARKIQQGVRRKILFGNVLLAFTLAFVVFIVGYYQPEMLTTKIGTLLVVIGIVMQIVASGGMIPLVKKAQSGQSAADYLRQMLLVKKKQAFLQTTIMSLYFVLLTLGIFLYMYEYTIRMSAAGMALAYGISGLWFAFSWFYLRPKTIKKQQRQLNEIIENLESVSRQLSEENN